MQIITRQEAVTQGLPRYFTGKHCKYGHVSERRSSGKCMDCELLYSHEWQKQNPEYHQEYSKEYYHENREQISARQKEYNKENAEKISQRNKAWYQEHREKRSEYNKKWKRDNNEKVSEYNQKWCIDNQEYKKKHRTEHSEAYRSYAHKRRSQTKSGEPSKVIAQWEKSQPKICYWCHTKCPKSYHVDHYVPLSKGGLHTINNLRISCPRCNLTKSSKDPYEFAQSKGRLF